MTFNTVLKLIGRMNSLSLTLNLGQIYFLYIYHELNRSVSARGLTLLPGSSPKMDVLVFRRIRVIQAPLIDKGCTCLCFFGFFFNFFTCMSVFADYCLCFFRGLQVHFPWLRHVIGALCFLYGSRSSWCPLFIPVEKQHSRQR